MSSHTLAFLSALTLLVPGALAARVERMVTVPTGWSQAGLADSSTSISLQIGLKMSNLDQLESKLKSVSDPSSPDYGKYLDKTDVDQLFAPSTEASDAVLSWLESLGITIQSNDGTWLSFKTTVGTANAMLGANYTHFVNAEGNTKIRTAQYQIPDQVVKHIDVVTPTVYLGNVKAQVKLYKQVQYSDSSSWNTTQCENLIDPYCLNHMYNIGNYTPDSRYGSRVGFGAFLNGSFNHDDLAAFQNNFGIPPQDAIVQSVNGGKDPAKYHDEANLDSQMLSAITHPLQITEFLTAGISDSIPDINYPQGPDSANEPWVPYYQYLNNLTNSELPQVISNSYGDDEQTVPKAYAQRVCNMIGFLGLRGITVISASGDSGLGPECITNDGSYLPRFIASFPPSCPYLTVVGGTTGVSPERGWNYSGGGFSDYFPQAYYQADSISNYLASEVSADHKSEFEAYTNFSGRAYPDVAAHAWDAELAVWSHGELTAIGGTSASAPIFAGIIGLLDDARLRAGRPAMGFLNPWLYDTGKQGLNDITEGYVGGCDQGLQVIPDARFNASKGWDPVTGWGTPNFQKLLKLALEC